MPVRSLCLKAKALKQLLTDQRGAVLTEYVVVVGTVGLATLPALLYCGWALVGNFSFVRNYLLYPFP